MCQLAIENSRHLTNTLSLVGVRKILWDARSCNVFHLSSPLQQDDTIYCDFRPNPRDKSTGCCDQHSALTDHDKEWLLYILGMKHPFASSNLIGLAGLRVNLVIHSQEWGCLGHIPSRKALC